MILDTDQQAAVARAVAKDGTLFAITGGAGTGKTTIIREIVKALPDAALVAFAGKAAARASEATGHPASTIHRYLGWQGDELGFTRVTSPTPVILDEASMVDSYLMARLVETRPPKFILVGDAAQLPPVGPGQPFHDLLRLRPELSHELTTCYRAQGAIHHASQEIRAGTVPASRKTAGESYTFLPAVDSRRAHEIVLDLAERGQIDPAVDLVVCPRNGEESQPGTRLSLNADLRRIYMPTDTDAKWRVGERVINVKNCANLDYWNGDTGTIIGLDTAGRPEIQLDRCRESGPVQLGAEEMRHLEHAYCLTVHKSQGSQYRRVVVVLRDADRYQLDRRMIYTAVTRAKEGCLVVGSAQALAQGIKTMRERDTVIQRLAAQVA